MVAGGGRIEGPGAYFEPTVLTDVTPDMLAYREELFGPVAVVYRVKDDDEAIAVANSSPYGLGGQVYCSDLERARRVADQLETGMIAINRGLGLGRKPSIRRGETLRARTRTVPAGHAGVRQPQARAGVACEGAPVQGRAKRDSRKRLANVFDRSLNSAAASRPDATQHVSGAV